jgi:hypothetical protein
MNERSKDRNLDDFINELKKSADKRFEPIDPETRQFEYEYILNNPDLLNRVSSLHVHIEDTRKQLKELDENQSSLKEQISELTNIVAEAPNQIANDVTQKVENFLTYYTNKVADKITSHEHKMELERKKILEEYQRLREEAKRLYENPTNPIAMGVPGSGMEAMPYLAFLKEELSKETKASHQELSSKLQSLEAHLSAFHAHQTASQPQPSVSASPTNQHVKTGILSTMPQWVYWLNLIFLGGIFLFLVHHFVSNYSIKIEPSYTRQQKDEVFQQTNSEPIPELLPIPDKQAEQKQQAGKKPTRSKDVEVSGNGSDVALVNYNDTNYLNSLLTVEQKRTLDSIR